MSLTHDQIAFHNVAALEPSPTGTGKILPRYPKAVRDRMSERGRFVSEESIGVEIRFVTEGANARVFLSCLEPDGEVCLFRGDFLVSRHPLSGGRIHCLHLSPPERFATVQEKMVQGIFSPNVWRIQFGRCTGVFHGLETFGHAVRPPMPEELPKRRYLAFGSSITHSQWLGYPFHVGRIHGFDVLNKGLSGACHIENETADFLIEHVAYDVASLELGVNMRDSYTPDVFGERARRLVKGLLARNGDKPHFLITIYPNFSDFPLPGKETLATAHDKAYDQILRNLVKDLNHPNLHLVEGSSMLTRMGGLTQDLIHPNEFGHAEMGFSLARQMEPWLSK